MGCHKSDCWQRLRSLYAFPVDIWDVTPWGGYPGSFCVQRRRPAPGKAAPCLFREMQCSVCSQARLMLVHSPFNLEFRDPALFSMYHMHDIHPSVLKSNRHTPCGSMATAWECTRNPLVIIPQSYLLRSYHWIHRDYLNLWFYLFLLPEIANWWVNGLHPNTSQFKGGRSDSVS